jgi:excisionase family DNA binding protein
MDDVYLTTAELLEYLQVNLRTVYRLLKAEEIPAVRVGRQWRFRKADIDAWLETRRPRGRRQATPAPAGPGGHATPASQEARPDVRAVVAPTGVPVAATAPATATPVPVETGRHPRILVADDEEAIRELLVKTLALAEYDVDTVPDGLQAVERLRTTHFDLLITDIRMPGLDGLGVIREARHLQPSLPVVIITGFSSEATAIEAIELGVTGYLTKPFRVPKVLTVAAKALGE